MRFHEMKNTLKNRSSAALLDYSYNKCFESVLANTDDLREEVFRLRYQIFCIEAGYEDAQAFPDGLERDAYDPRSKHILLKHRASGEYVGTLRIILPRRDDPLKSFPLQAVCNHSLIQDPQISSRLCEISRLCVSKSFRRRAFDRSIFSDYHQIDLSAAKAAVNQAVLRRVVPYSPIGLFKKAFEVILNEGLVDCIAVMEPRHIKQLLAIGFTYTPLGDLIEFHGQRQPMAFNLREVYVHAQKTGSLFYSLMSDNDRMFNQAIENEQAWGSATVPLRMKADKLRLPVRKNYDYRSMVQSVAG